jgi:phosphonate transport system permease protein
MTMTATNPADMRDQAEAIFVRKRRIAFAAPVLILLYLAYVFTAFDVAGIWERARMDNASALLRDSYSYKTHITRDTESGEITYVIEGERRGRYPEGTRPDWVTGEGDERLIDLGTGNLITFLPDNRVTWDIPDFGLIEMQITSDTVTTNLTEPIPDWINASDTRVAVTTPAGRLTVTASKTEVFRYAFGWEMFWFTLDSPYHGHSVWQIAFGPRIDPDRANITGALQDFWNNPLWRHKDVAWAMGETVLMAFLGTATAAIIALPLAFLAARNFAPLGPIRFAVRRIFDFVRGVDGLIWTIVLSRAFGPGPLTGTLAIAITDIGGFGKNFSEALENIDDKQVEGVRSTGANAVQRSRFGVIPQLTPVLLSQVLYYFESNTRSATVIGAITGGGIGLLLTQAIQTQKDWEEVTYYIILILVMVMIIDSLSGWLRRKLIKGE